MSISKSCSLLVCFLLVVASFILGIILSPGFFCAPDSQGTPIAPINRLYYSLPGALVGLFALIWNISNQTKINALTKANEQKNYHLQSFDAYVASPVREAIDTVDQLMSDIEGALHNKPSGKKNTQAEIEKIIENKVTPAITRAYRLCREADLYIGKGKMKRSFEMHMYYVSDDEKLDDLIIINLHNAQNADQPRAALNHKIRMIENTITKKKVRLRRLLTKTSTKIASSYD